MKYTHTQPMREIKVLPVPNGALMSVVRAHGQSEKIHTVIRKKTAVCTVCVDWYLPLSVLSVPL